MKEKPLDRATLRRFGLLVGGVLMGLFGLALPLLRRRHLPIWPWPPGALLVLVALAAPEGLRLFHRYWSLLGRVLGWFNTRVILTVVFFVIFAPAGLILRLLGKDPIARRRDATARSYRVTSNRNSNMEAPY
jgi:hypothetical protein